MVNATTSAERTLPRKKISTTFRKSLSTLLDFSYFITTDLRRDIEQRPIPGILPVLELILARQGHRVIEVLPVRCDARGTISSDPKVKGGSPGVRIRFKRAEHPEQTLYYFTKEDAPEVRSTEYRARPGERFRAVPIFLDKTALRVYDALKRHLKISDAGASRILRKLDRRSRPESE